MLRNVLAAYTWGPERCQACTSIENWKLRCIHTDRKSGYKCGADVKNKGKLAVSAGILLVCGVLHAQEKPTIEVSNATYGLNASERAAGTATGYLKAACDAKRSCLVAVKDVSSTVGDPAPRESKDFDFVYRCGGRTKKGHLNGESRGKFTLLTCAD